jgi:6-phosphogluconolactonase
MTIDAGIRILPDAGQVAQAAAALFVDNAVAAIQARGCFHACLAGGSTPRETYALLASGPKRGIDWTRVQVYFGDERCVPPDHADSNYRMAMDALLCQVNVEPAHIHRIPAELGVVPAADAYEQTLRACLASSENRFDLVFLGLGADGHTASLFPGTAAVGPCYPDLPSS